MLAYRAIGGFIRSISFSIGNNFEVDLVPSQIGNNFEVELVLSQTCCSKYNFIVLNTT